MRYALNSCNDKPWGRTACAVGRLVVLCWLATAVGCEAEAEDAAAPAAVASSGGTWRATLEGSKTLQVGVAASRTLRVTTASGGDPGALSASVAFIHTAMNHGGLVDPTATVGAGGAVAVADLQASMEGTWRLTLTVQDAAKAKPAEKVSFDFEVNP